MVFQPESSLLCFLSPAGDSKMNVCTASSCRSLLMTRTSLLLHAFFSPISCWLIEKKIQLHVWENRTAQTEHNMCCRGHHRPCSLQTSDQEISLKKKKKKLLELIFNFNDKHLITLQLKQLETTLNNNVPL